MTVSGVPVRRIDVGALGRPRTIAIVGIVLDVFAFLVALPPIAAKTSGVANRSVAAVNADHANTVSRLPRPENVATAPAGIARNAPTATLHPRRFSPRPIAHTPQKRPRNPTAIGT